MVRIEELRNGNYVDCIVDVGSIKTKCKVIDINVEDGVATFKDLSNNSEFVVNSLDKWELVYGILTCDEELHKLGFSYDSEMSVYALAEKGAWIKDKAVVQKYNGEYDLMVENADEILGCRVIRIPYIHMLQNAMADIYGIFKDT